MVKSYPFDHADNHVGRQKHQLGTIRDGVFRFCAHSLHLGNVGSSMFAKHLKWRRNHCLPRAYRQMEPRQICLGYFRQLPRLRLTSIVLSQCSPNEEHCLQPVMLGFGFTMMGFFKKPAQFQLCSGETPRRQARRRGITREGSQGSF